MEKQEILTKHLGVGGIEVPAIGIGTWAWGDRLFWGYGDRYGEAEVEAAFEAAIATGLTFLTRLRFMAWGNRSGYWVGLWLGWSNRSQLPPNTGRCPGG